MKNNISISNLRGFSLIELMIGMVLGLIGMVVIGQVFSTTEASKRSTTGGGDAVQNGAIAIYILDKDLSQAGYGFNDPTLFGCTTRAFHEQLGTPYTYIFAPVLITQGVGSAPDQLSVLYSTSTRNTAKTKIKVAVTNANRLNPYDVASNYGFNGGDVIILAEPNKFCIQSQVTGDPSSAAFTIVNPAPTPPTYLIQHNAGGSYTDLAGNVKQSTFNRPGAEPVPTTPTAGYTANVATVFNLGTAVNFTYSVDADGNLLSSAVGSSATAIIATGVLDFQAQYGVDNVDDDQNVVDIYQDTLPSNDRLRDVLSVRYGLVVRVGNRESDCTLTTVAPTWSGGTFNNVTNFPNWQCYRYRVFEGTTVLRNLMWRVGDL